MNILFIGGAGFIGSSLVKQFLSNEKYNVFVVEPEFANVSRLDGLNVKIYREALGNIDKVEKILIGNKIDIVVHLVSTLIPGSGYDDFNNEFKNMIFPSIKLMEICAKENIKFVYFSSGGTIYGNRSTMLPFVETDEMAPISYYGWSKQMMENSILFKNRTEKLKYLIVRPSNPYGHGQNLHGKQGLVAVAIGKILEDKPVEVWGDGSAIRDYIYIDDLAKVFYQLIDKDVYNETVNLGSGRGYSVNDILAFLKIITKKDFKIVYENARPMDVSNMVLDTEKMQRLAQVELTPMLNGISTFYNESVKQLMVMKRIAIIAGVLHSGGKRNLIMEYYRHIDRTQIQFDFICDSDSNGIPEEEILSLGGRVYKVTPYKHIGAHMRETYKILKDNNYEIMHAFDNTLNVFPMFLGWLAGVKVRISESISKGDKNEKKTIVKLALRPFSHWFANYYMANSIDCGVWQFGKKTYDKGEITIFKTVINADANAFDKVLRDETRKKFGWEDKVIYGFIGRYVDQKNPLFLIDIFNAIAKKQPNAKLVMIGFGELEKAMHEKIKEYGLQGSVEDLGRRDDIKQFYNAFDAFLLPSLYEGMPVVGIEAQCAGLPIFFSKNITEETTASELAHYIGLNESPEVWADTIINVVNANLSKRRSYAEEVKKNGFDSHSEAMRMMKFYLNKLQFSIS